jgi:NAD(P)-dependent dehydrogenase (short-subunit alcohol dehydrogenase family)
MNIGVVEGAMNAQSFSSSLRGRHVLIVGASSGIGLALAQATEALGAQVTLASRSVAKLEAAQRLVPTARVAPLDMLDEASVDGLFQTLAPVDHLVVTAVADELKNKRRLAEMTTETATRSLDKLWGSFFCARAAARSMVPGGSITLTASTAAFRPPLNGGFAMMNAASAAVAALGRSLALELRPTRVNVVVPGMVDSGVWDGLSNGERAAFRESAARSLPVGHLGEPAEVAHAFVFAMTNPYLTGSLITVDGGLSLT